MDLIKKLWPTPFNIKKGNLASFLIQLIIFIVITAVVGVLIGVLSGIAIIGVIFWIVGGLMEIYTIVGIVLCTLNFRGVQMG
jgi:hypothetical protein